MPESVAGSRSKATLVHQTSGLRRDAREPPYRRIAWDSLQLRHERQPLGQLAGCLQHRNGSGPGDRWKVGLVRLSDLQQLQWRADDRWLVPE
jgi:hypothetical protein